MRLGLSKFIGNKKVEMKESFVFDIPSFGATGITAVERRNLSAAFEDLNLALKKLKHLENTAERLKEEAKEVKEQLCFALSTIKSTLNIEESE